MVGNPAFNHSSNPPLRAMTFLYPLEWSVRAILALVASFGQVQ